jgi:hypothetical protein
MKNKTVYSQLTKASASTGFGNSRGGNEKLVDVDALVSPANKSEKRLGHMPVAQMLAEIHAVFPNAKIL